MDPKKILIAVDASENSLRAIKYTGDMLGGGEGFHIALLTIERFPDRDLFESEEAWKTECKKNQAAYLDFMAKGRKILCDKGISEKQIFTRYIESCKSPLKSPPLICSMGTSIAHEIIRIIEREGFGTVVIGRRGVSKEVEFLFGSVSTKIVHYSKGCAVWIVN